ncbi:lysophosphatidic acid receptor 4-like [Spea bombifrons]|uniref:lysophosphatidic acid receptor 4-like n=1 Tax=Spea bombifrons TaxID=233779 RepID=UPI0023492533|nr:lysophosphatidic acid receptor 4-like [Spea bombifrons]
MMSLSRSLDSAANIALICFHVIVVTLGVSLNGIVVVTILSTKALRSENRFLYIFNTCISDLLLGMVWFYIALFQSQEDQLGTAISQMIMYNLMGVIFLTILSSQSERYFAVVYPFRYMSIMTKGRTTAVLVFCWVFVLSMRLFYGLLGKSTTSAVRGITNIISNLAIFIIIVGFNLKLFLIAKGQQEREFLGLQDTKKSSLRLIIIVSCTFLLFWTPSSVRECVCSFYSCVIYEKYATDPFKILIIITSVTNPMLFLWGSQAIREAFWKIHAVCKLCKRQIDPQMPAVANISGRQK